jgi:DNA polymerase-3 subunit alpha
VANIVTFGTMAARNAVRDVARVLQVPYAEADRWSKMIPAPVQGRHIPLESASRKIRPQKRIRTNEKAKEVFDLAVRVEGTIRSPRRPCRRRGDCPGRHRQVRAARNGPKGRRIDAVSEGSGRRAGLLKMDFLGLSNLTVINNTLRIIRKVYGRKLTSTPCRSTTTDYKLLFQRGDTTGVFQFESSGMKRYLRELKATEFEDVIAMGALYRPGPLQRRTD